MLTNLDLFKIIIACCVVFRVGNAQAKSPADLAFNEISAMSITNANGTTAYETWAKDLMSQDVMWKGNGRYFHYEDRNANDATGQRKRQDRRSNFSYSNGVIGAAGYVKVFYAGSVSDLQQHCFTDVSAGDCFDAALMVAADTVLVTVSAAGAGLYAIGLVQGAGAYFNQYATGSASGQVKRQSCPVNNGGLENDDGVNFSDDRGIKVFCNSGCLGEAVSEDFISQFVNYLGNEIEANDGYGAQFTVYDVVSTQVFARCGVVLETGPTDTCAEDISGTSCTF